MSREAVNGFVLPERYWRRAPLRMMCSKGYGIAAGAGKD
jgi:hypothetical protein